jgi:hypothetical protein
MERIAVGELSLVGEDGGHGMRWPVSITMPLLTKRQSLRGYNHLPGMRVNTRIVKISESDHRRRVKCDEATCNKLAEYVSNDQEISNGLLMAHTERLQCEDHAKDFAAARGCAFPT